MAALIVLRVFIMGTTHMGLSKVFKVPHLGALLERVQQTKCGASPRTIGRRFNCLSYSGVGIVPYMCKLLEGEDLVLEFDAGVIQRAISSKEKLLGASVRILRTG
jgi:hypothetical protein